MKFDKGHVDTQRIFSFFRTQRWKNHIFWTIFASSSIRMKNVNAEIVETSRDAQATGNYWIIADWSCKTSSFWNIRTRKEKKFHGFFFLNKNIQNNIDLYVQVHTSAMILIRWGIFSHPTSPGLTVIEFESTSIFRIVQGRLVEFTISTFGREYQIQTWQSEHTFDSWDGYTWKSEGWTLHVEIHYDFYGKRSRSCSHCLPSVRSRTGIFKIVFIGIGSIGIILFSIRFFNVESWNGFQGLF